MGFPEDMLTKDEHVVLHLNPHWKALIRPVFVLVVGIAAIVTAWAMLDSDILLYAVIAVALGLIVWLSFWPWLVWKTTQYVFTSERVILQHGVFSRERRDIPLSRVNDHSMNQRFLERMLGCGTLVIESAGERGQTILRDIPGVAKVQTTLYELVDNDRDKHSLGDDEMREIMKSSQQPEGAAE